MVSSWHIPTRDSHYLSTALFCASDRGTHLSWAGLIPLRSIDRAVAADGIAQTASDYGFGSRVPFARVSKYPRPTFPPPTSPADHYENIFSAVSVMHCRRPSLSFPRLCSGFDSRRRHDHLRPANGVFPRLLLLDAAAIPVALPTSGIEPEDGLRIRVLC